MSLKPPAQRIYMRARHQSLAAAGRCVQCARQPAQPDRKRCADCLEWQRAYQRARYVPRSAPGVGAASTSPVVPAASGADAMEPAE